MKTPALHLGLFGFAVLHLLASAPCSRADSTIDPAAAFAWGGNIGWTNWRPSAADGAVIGEYVCSGSGFCANIGWVNMGSGTPADGIRYGNAAAGDFGVNFTATVTPGRAALRGFAYGANIGWINFEDLGDPHLDLTTGALTGYAWSANCGWINLGTDTPNGVTTTSIAPGADTDADGLADAFEYENFSDLATGSDTTDLDGDGQSDLSEALDGTDPRDPDDSLRIVESTLFTDAVTDAMTLTFSTNTTRLYRIEQSEDLTLGGGWIDSGLGDFLADDLATARTVASPAGPRRFYRVLALRPLLSRRRNPRQ